METMTIELEPDPPLLDDLLSYLAAGSEIILTKDERPFARITPIQIVPKARLAGLHAGAIKMADDFNAPLPDSFWIGNE
jgi:antitoxin (DNA-binding transcriptional repressor) of toxin-antitoxin stability system